MVDAVVSFVMEKLGDFLIQEAVLLGAVKTIVMWLKDVLAETHDEMLPGTCGSTFHCITHLIRFLHGTHGLHVKLLVKIKSSDSMVASAWVNGTGGVGNVSLMEYIMDIKDLMANCISWLSVTHVSRSSNAAADFLAKQGAIGRLDQVVWA
ncbi:hypothetical protein EZV62_006862 [Acer yangbiense]|uniref:Uncharacterized protein n=1 Tax=Acer yangbiense TaxID=1000413 RepID=A0A5C7I8U1_9ROSI|nr:hypothetical protein EZV62_006862 [Acer yangbiense]